MKKNVISLERFLVVSFYTSKVRMKSRYGLYEWGMSIQVKTKPWIDNLLTILIKIHAKKVRTQKCFIVIVGSSSWIPYSLTLFLSFILPLPLSLSLSFLAVSASYFLWYYIKQKNVKNYRTSFWKRQYLQSYARVAHVIRAYTWKLFLIIFP